jgi:hypothetical protein
MHALPDVLWRQGEEGGHARGQAANQLRGLSIWHRSVRGV